jgi:steroid 5-alpha reductase family enzyme
MAIDENLKMHMIWALLIFNIAFWLYIASKQKPHREPLLLLLFIPWLYSLTVHVCSTY